MVRDGFDGFDDMSGGSGIALLWRALSQSITFSLSVGYRRRPVNQQRPLGDAAGDQGWPANGRCACPTEVFSLFTASDYLSPHVTMLVMMMMHRSVWSGRVSRLRHPD
jgi:hypothetical protein